MVSKLEIMKTLFSEFLLESQGKSIHNKDAKDPKILNSQVFEFQSFMAAKLEKIDLNLRINPSIISTEITDSFKRSDQPISANEYCLSFFDFLNYKKKEKLELFELIDQFIQAHLSELTWRDIVITATGATRCKTNIRFALDQLRGIGLIKHLDENNKRSFTPSIVGELVYYHWRKSLDSVNINAKNSTENAAHDIYIKKSDFSKLHSFFNQLYDLKEDKGGRMIKEFLDSKINLKVDKEIDQIRTRQAKVKELYDNKKIPISEIEVNEKESEAILLDIAKFLIKLRKFIANNEITENGIKLKKKVKE
jgi:hypothetical protein